MGVLKYIVPEEKSNSNKFDFNKHQSSVISPFLSVHQWKFNDFMINTILLTFPKRTGMLLPLRKKSHNNFHSEISF